MLHLIFAGLVVIPSNLYNVPSTKVQALILYILEHLYYRTLPIIG